MKPRKPKHVSKRKQLKRRKVFVTVWAAVRKMNGQTAYEYSGLKKVSKLGYE